MSWGSRDAGIAELCEYFDRPEVVMGGWERLSGKPNELRVVQQEILKCRHNFEYCARNYFWITDKHRRDIPFNLWPSQELLYEKVKELKARRRAQKLIILKGRQLGFSVLIEGLITWRTIFYSNVNSLIVSHAPHHSSYLFQIMQHFIERLPFFLRPMIRSLKIEEGLVFENPDTDDSRFNPGLNSRVVVQAANQLSGVGQGYRLSAVHCSELADVEDWRAKQIIEGDLAYALAENEETMAFIETTAKGQGRYFHKLWEKCVEMGDKAEWIPAFFPAFMEKSRFMAPEEGWRPDEHEERIRERVSKEWLACTSCKRFLETRYGGKDQTGERCTSCLNGTMEPYVLSDGQLAWFYYKRLNSQKDIESLKECKQELCLTVEDAFQISGVQVFPYETFDWVEQTLSDPLATGFFDAGGVFHGIDHKTGVCPVEGCDVDHAYDDKPIRLWEYPQKDETYLVGVDVSEGIGGDYSVIFVNKISQYGAPDEQVAVYRSNMVDPISFSFPCAQMGKWYNEAIVSIEVNKYDTTFSWVRNQLQYPNLYRWKHIDSTNLNSNKWGWETNMKSRPRLYQTGIKFLKAKMWIIHDREFYKEMMTFQKDDYEDRVAEHDLGAHDDVLMAGLIALYCSHDMDYDENLGFIPIRRQNRDIKTYPWQMYCMKCSAAWGAMDPNQCGECPRCMSQHIRGEKNQIAPLDSAQKEYELMTSETPAEELVGANADYELM